MPDLVRLEQIKSQLSQHGIKLVAVSKTKPVEDIEQLYHAGHKIFGENRVRELVNKYEQLPKDIEWHMIGHLQSNKVKYIAPFVHLIHGVDSFKLLAAIDKQGAKHNRIIDCLLQIHIAEEATKHGFSFEDLMQLLASGQLADLHHVRITGLMGMATFTSDNGQIRKEFREIAGFYQTIKTEFFKDQDHFRELSIGMSGDYEIAMEEGSTMVRIGSLIFGER